jgi:hypothetical protein
MQIEEANSTVHDVNSSASPLLQCQSPTTGVHLQSATTPKRLLAPHRPEHADVHRPKHRPKRPLAQHEPPESRPAPDVPLAPKNIDGGSSTKQLDRRRRVAQLHRAAPPGNTCRGEQQNEAPCSSPQVGRRQPWQALAERQMVTSRERADGYLRQASGQTATLGRPTVTSHEWGLVRFLPFHKRERGILARLSPGRQNASPVCLLFWSKF